MSAVVRPADARLARLVAYIWRNNGQRFRFGSHDCCLFACKWVDEELGTDYVRRSLTHIEDRGWRASLAAIRNPGGYRDLVCEVTGVAPSIDGKWSPGDVAVFVQDDRSESLGIVSRRLVHSPGLDRVITQDASRVLCHWSLSCLPQ